MVLTAAQCQVFMQIHTVASVLHLQMKNAGSDKPLLRSPHPHPKTGTGLQVPTSLYYGQPY